MLSKDLLGNTDAKPEETQGMCIWPCEKTFFFVSAEDLYELSFMRIT